MGTRDTQMGTSKSSQSQQNTGKPNRKDKRFEELWGHLHRELGELSVVTGAAADAVREFDYRRIESLQGSIDQAFQSAEKILKELQATYYSDRYTDPSRDG